ncbi:hypothetical protein J4526_08320 [Desulfurococcaceae archaeon MEX13E-LK6-19]|nr:hypothetical protein J4526_08320 [Desulfurococcaceae archaeon MEX13E-LK6-19]
MYGEKNRYNSIIQHHMETIAKKFWSKWLESSEDKQVEMIRPIAREILELAEIKAGKETKIDTLTLILNTYFHDLRETLEHKLNHEKHL